MVMKCMPCVELSAGMGDVDEADVADVVERSGGRTDVAGVVVGEGGGLGCGE